MYLFDLIYQSDVQKVQFSLWQHVTALTEFAFQADSRLKPEVY